MYFLLYSNIIHSHTYPASNTYQKQNHWWTLVDQVPNLCVLSDDWILLKSWHCSGMFSGTWYRRYISSNIPWFQLLCSPLYFLRCRNMSFCWLCWFFDTTIYQRQQNPLNKWSCSLHTYVLLRLMWNKHPMYTQGWKRQTPSPKKKVVYWIARAKDKKISFPSAAIFLDSLMFEIAWITASPFSNRSIFMFSLCKFWICKAWRAIWSSVREKLAWLFWHSGTSA